jgi:hypothetical protein
VPSHFNWTLLPQQSSALVSHGFAQKICSFVVFLLKLYTYSMTLLRLLRLPSTPYASTKSFELIVKRTDQNLREESARKLLHASSVCSEDTGRPWQWPSQTEIMKIKKNKITEYWLNSLLLRSVIRSFFLFKIFMSPSFDLFRLGWSHNLPRLPYYALPFRVTPVNIFSFSPQCIAICTRTFSNYVDGHY